MTNRWVWLYVALVILGVIVLIFYTPVSFAQEPEEMPNKVQQAKRVIGAALDQCLALPEQRQMPCVRSIRTILNGEVK